MARTPFVAGNWKMNTTAEAALELVKGLVDEVGRQEGCTMAVCPPAVYLKTVAEALRGSLIALGAQNMYYEDSGAYTGEIAPGMLRDCCCSYVILGHSERRHVFGETDALVNAKVLKALEVGLDPILCVGETLSEREAGRTMSVVERHVAWGLRGVDPAQAARVTVAYEPVWAIGTGKVAQPEDANEVHTSIRKLLADVLGDEAAETIRIQYGGSVKPSNAEGLAAMSDIDGFLVGGASLKAGDFAEIIRKTCAVKGA
jgi:triosephosphate isomerase